MKSPQQQTLWEKAKGDTDELLFNYIIQGDNYE